LGLMLKISWKSDKEWLQENVLKISGLICELKWALYGIKCVLRIF
jgi:hypothetical protein